MVKKLTQGTDQSYARVVNNELVIQKLRESEYSATEIAEFLNLSNATMSSILKGLLQTGLIKISHSIAKYQKGRKQICYTLDENYGLILVVSLSDNRYKIIISNIKEEILLSDEKQIDTYDISTIHTIVLKIKDMLSNSEYSNIPVKQIVIAVPGRVNSVTGELQLSKHFDKNLFESSNTIIEIFKKHFDAPIYMENDMNLAIIGEMKCDYLKNASNAMLVYVDNGMGGAFILNNDFYGGDFGYAGEIGLMSANFDNQENFIDEFVSLRSLKNYAAQKYSCKMHVNDIVNKYNSDVDFKKYVLETAHVLGTKLRDIVELLNLSDIVILGRVSLFGDDYLNCVRQEIEKSQNKCKVLFSKLGKNSILLGAISSSVDKAITVIETKKAAVHV